MQKYIVVEGACSIILRITAHHLHLAFRSIGEIDKVMQHVEQTTLVEQSSHHCLQRRNAVYRAVLRLHLSPRRKEIVVSKERPELVVHTIGDNHEGVVAEQTRYVTSIAHGELFVSILNSGVLLDSILELKHNKRQSVYIDYGIRYAQLLNALHLQLIHDAVAVVVLVVIAVYWVFMLAIEVNRIDVEIRLGGVLALHRETIHQEFHEVVVLVIERAS